LPPELLFAEGGAIPTRKASEVWFEWAMKHTAFFYIGSGDLMKSILTGKAESVYGVVSEDNKLGRGLRFGGAEAGRQHPQGREQRMSRLHRSPLSSPSSNRAVRTPPGRPRLHASGCTSGARVAP